MSKKYKSRKLDEWVCYLISSGNRTYIGSSNNAKKRLATHNSGKGAKATRGRQWKHVIIISGFTKISCLSFEAGWKRLSKRRSNKRFDNINRDLSYTGKNTIHKRFLDLLYFVTYFNFETKKFALNDKIRKMKKLNKPKRLCIHCLNKNRKKYLKKIPFPKFIKLVQSPNH